jgi:hypothetical protein
MDSGADWRHVSVEGLCGVGYSKAMPRVAHSNDSIGFHNSKWIIFFINGQNFSCKVSGSNSVLSPIAMSALRLSWGALRFRQ